MPKVTAFAKGVAAAAAALLVVLHPTAAGWALAAVAAFALARILRAPGGPGVAPLAEDGLGRVGPWVVVDGCRTTGLRVRAFASMTRALEVAQTEGGLVRPIAGFDEAEAVLQFAAATPFSIEEVALVGTVVGHTAAEGSR